MIYSKAAIRRAYEFALVLLPDDEAITAIADAYGIDEEVIRQALEEVPA